MNVSGRPMLRLIRRSWSAGPACRLGSADDPGDGSPPRAGSASDPAKSEDLPYKVELWNSAKTSVEMVLAVTANGSIGYAAYYAATREYPNRHITLRYRNNIMSRWNGHEH